jgi:hypothetical protein
MNNGLACVILALQKSCLIYLHYREFSARKKETIFGEALINMNVVNINNYEPLQLRYCNVTTKSKLTTSDSITDYEKKNQPVKKKNFT